MFILYRQNGTVELSEKSVGKQKGMYGIVNAQALGAMASLRQCMVGPKIAQEIGWLLDK